MNVFDDDLATAIELIEEFGGEWTWTKPAAQASEEHDPWRDIRDEPEPEAEPLTAKIAVLPYDKREYGLAAIEGTEVPASSIVGYMAGGLAFTPELTDKIDDGTDFYDIVKIDILKPNGLPLLYTLWLKA